MALIVILHFVATIGFVIAFVLGNFTLQVDTVSYIDFFIKKRKKVFFSNEGNQKF